MIIRNRVILLHLSTFVIYKIDENKNQRKQKQPNMNKPWQLKSANKCNFTGYCSQ